MKVKTAIKRRRFLSILTTGLAAGCMQTKQNQLTDLNPIPLSAWGSPEMAKPGDIDPMNRIKRITVHHDGLTPEPLETDQKIRERLKAIRKLHQERFADIGYHFIVDPMGRIWSGRPLDCQGAHVSGQNEHNVGILVLGNFEDDRKPTAEALTTLYDLIQRFMKTYNIKTKMIFTHCEFNDITKCPGKNLQTEMVKARAKGGPLTLTTK